MRQSVLIVLLAVLNTLTCWASNFHEHFSSLFLADNFASLGSDVFSIPVEEQLLSKTLVTYERYLLFMKVNFDLSEEAARQTVTPEDFAHLTIKDLCHSLPGDPVENFRHFVFIEKVGKGLSSADVRKIYATQEDIRTHWIKSLSSEHLIRLYRHYFEADQYQNWKEMHISIPEVFLHDPVHQWRYSTFTAMAMHYKAKVKTFVSVRRDKIKSAIKRLEGDHGIDGLDITSSLFEDNQEFEMDKMKKVKAELLTNLLDFMSETKQELRIHAFEAANTGPFYDILKFALENHRRPVRLRIGHINHITPEWLDLMAKNKNLDIRFDVNGASNFWLHSTPVAEVLKKIRMIHSYGFKTNLGSDGRGILPGSSYLEQLGTLRKMGYNYQCIQFYVP